MPVVLETVTLQPTWGQGQHGVGFEPGPFPDLRHGHVADTKLFGQLPRRPMSRAIGRRLPRSVDDTSFQLWRDDPSLATSVTRVQATQAVLLKASLPARDVFVGKASRLKGAGATSGHR